MLQHMIKFFVSGFIYPGMLWNQALLGIGLAIVFGAIWFTAYWTPVLKKPSVWAVLTTSAFLTWIAISFIQIPFQSLAGQALNHFWSQEILMRWLLLAAIPQILLSGLVQEGAKLVPVVIYWGSRGRNIDPKLGLAIGAIAGLGFGVFEAVWVHNQILTSGWTWEAVQSGGLIMLIGFWERFFTVAFHISSCAIAGWGLAKGWGWQFYLLASLLHALLNYSVVFLQTGLFTNIQGEIYITAVAVLITAGALWLRWRKTEPAMESISGCE